MLLYLPNDPEGVMIRSGHASADGVDGLMAGLGFPESDKVVVQRESESREFGIWHHHHHDEVRFCEFSVVGGSFSFKTRYNGSLALTHVTLLAGDWIIIPAGAIHFFNGSGEFRRYFKGPAVWEPIYETARPARSADDPAAP